MLVKTIKTPCTIKEFCKALIQSWFELYNQIPSKASIGVIISQWGIETGSGAHCYNYNFTNIKYNKSNGEVDYCALNGVWEIINGKRVEIPATDPGAWFRSFPTINDGAKFYLNFLKTSHFKTSWVAIEAGNVPQFATLLKSQNFYTAPLQDYINGMNRFFTPYMKSQDYENALSEINLATPPLQPWVSIPDVQAPQGELTANIPDSTQDGSAQVIEPKTSKFVGMFKGFLEAVSGWLKPKL